MAGAALFLPIFFLLSGGAHVLFAHWLVRSFPKLRPRARLVYAVVVVLGILPGVRALTRLTHSDLPREIFAAGLVEVVAVVLGAVPLLVLRAILRAKQSKPEASQASQSSSPPKIDRREALERAGGLAAYGTTATVLGWGIVRGRHAFELEEIAVKIPGLPRVLDGYTIVQISDIHTGPFVQERELDEGLELVKRARGDLVVVTGDLVDLDPRWCPLIAGRLAKLGARDGVVAITGNHDHYAGADGIASVVRKAGIDMFINQGRVIRPDDGGGFGLLGVDDLWAREKGGEGPDLERSIAAVPKDVPRILLAHQPQFFKESAGQVALQLSGHTHGGQINPGFRPADLFFDYVAGRYERQGSTLYVNRGFGVAGPPSRVGAAPEVTKIVLVSA